MPPIPRQLPPDVSRFTGRRSELGELDSASTDATAVVISAIAGAPGMGKTSLAVHWAHQSRERFPDGELYVNLRGFDPGPPVPAEQALNGFLHALGLLSEQIPRTVEAMSGIYRSLLAGRRMLVVLDNAATAEQVRPLLPGSPSCMVIVTSRNRLSGLVARDGAQRVTLDILSLSEATSLLRSIVGGRRVDEEPAATAALARMCGCLPLALRIVAERVTRRPQVRISKLMAELSSEHDRLDALTSDDDEMATVRATFSWSYRALNLDAARMFRLLGLNPGPHICTSAAAALVDITENEARRQLDALVSVHLITEVQQDRFQFHDLLRTYAFECSKDDDDYANATTRLLEWYLHSAHSGLFSLYPQHPVVPLAALTTHVKPLTIEDRPAAIAWFDAEYLNLMAVIRKVAEHGNDTVAWQLPNIIDCYQALREYADDRIEVHQLGLKVARRIQDKLGMRWALGHLGEAYEEVDRLEETVPLAIEALAIAREIGDRWGEANSMLSLGRSRRRQGLLDQAEMLFSEGLSAYREVGHRRNEGNALINLAQVFHLQKRTAESLVFAVKAIEIQESIGNLGGASWTRKALAQIYIDLGRNVDAIEHLLCALRIDRISDRPRSVAETLDSLGRAFQLKGDSAEARVHWLEALEIFENLNSPVADKVRDQLGCLPGD
ncbi:hypothetical protein GCM10027598_62610 [Amycolatopsis oliviviridis]|uniref:NB-ARC domain-containing protein n=1 Tax=Amycolatopsis oliviviridis TaxID=1471590 RepID=A0ABQ3M4C7_9PSEU|nr:tetratricopeptide repeat protein [Amycolatopsis oliviviridis]GHH32971.1 hypothetical protein GCM10017790_70900 [Amycolatopsis oliviviridis]